MCTLSLPVIITSLPKVIWEQGRVTVAVPGAGWHKGLRIRNVCILFVKDRCANVRYFSVRKQNKVRVWRCMAIGNAFVLQMDSVRRQDKEQKKVKQYCEL